MTVQILTGDCRTMLATLDACSVQTCVTSPPYFGLRDYGHDGQIGLEQTPDAYVAELVAVFREVRRVMADDGTLWLNLGDSYAGSGKGGNPEDGKQASNKGSQSVGVLYGKVGETAQVPAVTNITRRTVEIGMKPKDLIGIPWRVAFALQADGWYLRSDIIWHKPNPMPESVTDRPTKAHEYVFLLTKSARYFYDAKAIAEPAKDWSVGGPGVGIQQTDHYGAENGGNAGLSALAKRYKSGNKERKYGDDVDRPGSHLGRGIPWEGDTRNARTVWTITTKPFKGSHFATMPPELAERCIKAGSRIGDTVLDPFGGAGTTGLVADRLQRNAVLVELNPVYADMARRRILDDAPLFGDAA